MRNKEKMMKKKMINNNKLFLFSFTFISLFLTFCRTTPLEKVKIIEERDPVVKNIEEKDSMRKILPNTTHHKNIENKH